MEVYLLVNHEQQKAEQSESWTYVRLSSDQKDTSKILSDVYRHMPDLLQLVVLLSVYDNLPAIDIAELLACGEEIVSCLLRKADQQFSGALGQTASRESLYAMLEYEIEDQALSADLVERVRRNLCETLFGAA